MNRGCHSEPSESSSERTNPAQRAERVFERADHPSTASRASSRASTQTQHSEPSESSSERTNPAQRAERVFERANQPSTASRASLRASEPTQHSEPSDWRAPLKAPVSTPP